MDKLRALQYFVASAQERSFTAASRRLEVSVPAILKLVNALERNLGGALFDRSAQGLKLTAAGERYLEACQPALAQLHAADLTVRAGASEPRGTIIVGAHAELVDMPWLSEFHGLYPDVHIDVRPVTRATIQTTPADVYLVHGWPVQPDMVRRVVAQPQLLTCASPDYWANYGIPACPEALADHECLLYCNDEGTVNDLWLYERQGEKLAITARGWLVSSARTVMVAAALAGKGVLRASDLLVVEHLKRGSLIPVLREWDMADAPPFNMLYRSHQRRNALTRAFMDFVVEAFRKLEAEQSHRAERRPFVERPSWSRRGYRRASAGRSKTRP